MMSELVDEDVRGLLTVRGDSAVQTKNPAAAISARVCDDLDELVWCKLGDVSKRAILKCQNVSLGAERIVACAEGRRSMDSRRRPRNPGLFSGGTQCPDVEVSPTFFVRRCREKDFQQPSGVFLEFATFRGSVAVAKNQEIDLARRIATFL